MAEQGRPSGNGEASPRVNFDYIKGQQFRVIHADGAIGGLTPNGHIHMSLYSERPPIPRRMVFTIEGSRLGNELLAERVVRDAIVREVDIDVIMTVDVAESLVTWLTEKVIELRKMGETRKDTGGPKQ